MVSHRLCGSPTRWRRIVTEIFRNGQHAQQENLTTADDQAGTPGKAKVLHLWPLLHRYYEASRQTAHEGRHGLHAGTEAQFVNDTLETATARANGEGRTC